MPSKSKKQQKLFGLALSVKRGDTPKSEVSSDVLKIVDTMSEKNIKKYASTKHDDLPNKSVEESIRKLVKEILTEEEYDYYRDYKAGNIDKATYDKLVKDFQKTVPKSTHPYVKWKDAINKYGSVIIYLNISFSEKDKFKKNYFGIKWDSSKKSWYIEIPKTPAGVKFTDDLKSKVNDKLTPAQNLKFIK
jgi:hypothetical protein